jgi:hypothetical protein
MSTLVDATETTCPVPAATIAGTSRRSNATGPV